MSLFEKGLPFSELVKTPAKTIAQQFHAIERICLNKKAVDMFKKFDIYTDIHPYEETIVWLGDQKYTDLGYINCSRI